MAVEVIMPKVDMVMETGTFVEWLKHEGDKVEKGDALFVISTEKAAIEVDSPADGILVGLSAQPDDIIPVTKVIGYIIAPGEELPEKLNVEPEIKPTEPEEGSNSKDEYRDEITGKLVSIEKPRATPLARRMAEDLGIDLNHISGRGPLGRIHKADILDYQNSHQFSRDVGDSSSAYIPNQYHRVQPPSETRRSAMITLPNARKREVVTLSGPRKIIAERMTYSAFTAPHINLTVRVDMSDVLRFRQHLQEKRTSRENLPVSITAVLGYCVAKVLPNHPYVNASLSGDEIILWEDIHLGIAMNVEGNLIVPVIREVQKLSIYQISEAMVDLVDRGRNRRLLPAEMSGSTFTISNLGMYGIESFTAVINPPESAILAVGKIVEMPIRDDGQIAFKPMMHLTVSADHRVLDGASVASFLQDLKSSMEDPFFLAKNLA